jgi:hypothetical protein
MSASTSLESVHLFKSTEVYSDKVNGSLHSGPPASVHATCNPIDKRFVQFSDGTACQTNLIYSVLVREGTHILFQAFSVNASKTQCAWCRSLCKIKKNSPLAALRDFNAVIKILIQEPINLSFKSATLINDYVGEQFFKLAHEDFVAALKECAPAPQLHEDEINTRLLAGSASYLTHSNNLDFAVYAGERADLDEVPTGFMG